MDAKVLARDERSDLAEFLATLTPAQWEAPSLCPGWRVRDVVAHMFSYEELGVGGLLGRFITGGLRLSRVNAVGVARAADRSIDELLALAREHLRPRGITTGFGGLIALTDAVIHHQDIRRPLGLPRDVPAERVLRALPFACTTPPLSAGKRIRGLTLATTDLDWTRGTGPVVEGPAEAMLMAIAGRGDAVVELSGPGQPILAGRIGV